MVDVMFLSILSFRSLFRAFYRTKTFLSLTSDHVSIYLKYYCLILLLFPGKGGRINVLAAFCSCSSLCFISTHAYKRTCFPCSRSVRTYIRGREQCLAPAELSSNTICFQRNNSSPYEQPAETASACPCLLGRWLRPVLIDPGNLHPVMTKWNHILQKMMKNVWDTHYCVNVTAAK